MSALLGTVLLAAGCGGGSAGVPDGPADAPPVSCSASRDCGPGNWCNPLGSICEPRGSAIDFDHDVYPELRDVCSACHMPGGPGAKDALGTGTIALFSGGPAQAHDSLVAGGTDCSVKAARLCVDEPRNSLAVIRLLPGAMLPNQTFVLPDGYADPWMQLFLRWIAAGAVRVPRPDAGTADARGPDARPGTPDAPPGTPDAPIAGPPDAPPGTPDAPIAGPPDAPPGTPDAPIAGPPDAPPAPPDAKPQTPDARPRPDGGPDASVSDTTPPTGGAVTGGTSDACGQVTLTLSATTDDRTAAADITHEICYSTTSGGCLSSFTVKASIVGTGPYTIDASASDNSKLFFAARARDQAGNVNAPAGNVGVMIPSFLSWPAGNPTVTLGTAPGSYSVSWPEPSSLCPSLGPLSVQLCVGASCMAVVSPPVQVDTSCATTMFTVRATAGRTVLSRSTSSTWTISFTSIIMPEYGSRCQTCHTATSPFPDGFPSFTTADVGHPSAVCTGDVLIASGDPAASQIYSVAHDKAFLCGGAHADHSMTSDEVANLRCWIEQGAPP